MQWSIQVGDPKLGYSITHAPLVIKDKVMVGVAGGEYGIRGFIAAYDAKTGKEVWKFYTVAGPEDPKAQASWAKDSWQHGGAPAWLTGSYDPELNLTYWGTGNPGPDWNGDDREGDNLYSDSRSRSMPTRARSSGISSSRRMTSSITTRCRFRCWSTGSGTGSRAR